MTSRIRPGFLLTIFLITCACDSATAQDGRWNTLTVNDGLPENEIRSIFEDSDGRIWFGTRRAGIGVLADNKWTYYTSEDGLASDGITAFAQDDSGHIWAAGGRGYAVFDGSTWTTHTEVGPIETNVVFSINKDADGGFWLAANGGAVGIHGQNRTTILPEDGLPHSVVHAALRDKEGTIWLASRTGLAEVRDGTIRVYYPEHNFGSILADDSGGLWFGTRGAGAFHGMGDGAEQHLAGRDVRPVMIDDANRVWAVSDDNGAYVYDGSDWMSFTVDDGLASNTVFDVIQAQDGSYWFATADGVSRWMP